MKANDNPHLDKKYIILRFSKFNAPRVVDLHMEEYNMVVQEYRLQSNINIHRYQQKIVYKSFDKMRIPYNKYSVYRNVNYEINYLDCELPP